MNDVVRNYLNMGETLMRGFSHEVVFPHSHLATRIPCKPADGWHYGLDKDLGIPVVSLKEKKLSARLQETKDRIQIFCIQRVAKNRRTDNVIEVRRRQI